MHTDRTLLQVTAAANSGAATATPSMRLESLTVEPISLISGEVELPGSKSLSNRVLLLSALAEVTHSPDLRPPPRPLPPVPCPSPLV